MKNWVMMSGVMAMISWTSGCEDDAADQPVTDGGMSLPDASTDAGASACIAEQPVPCGDGCEGEAVCVRGACIRTCSDVGVEALEGALSDGLEVIANVCVPSGPRGLFVQCDGEGERENLLFYDLAVRSVEAKKSEIVLHEHANGSSVHDALGDVSIDSVSAALAVEDLELLPFLNVNGSGIRAAFGYQDAESTVGTLFKLHVRGAGYSPIRHKGARDMTWIEEKKFLVQATSLGVGKPDAPGIYWVSLPTHTQHVVKGIGSAAGSVHFMEDSGLVLAGRKDASFGTSGERLYVFKLADLIAADSAGAPWDPGTDAVFAEGPADFTFLGSSIAYRDDGRLMWRPITTLPDAVELGTPAVLAEAPFTDAISVDHGRALLIYEGGLLLVRLPGA